MNKADYKNVFVFVEQRGGVIQPVAFELIGKARELADALGEKVVALFPGCGIKAQAQTLIEAGADQVIVMDAPELKDYLTEQYSQAIHQAIMHFMPSIVLIGATTIGRDLGPRLSARLETGLTADCTKLEISEEKELMMTRPAFGGNLMATIMCTEHRPQMSTVRPGVMRRRELDKSRKGEVVDFAVKFDASKFNVKLLETVKNEGNQVDITEAKILVSGGRGVQNTEGFAKLQQLADVFGSKAQVSSSRAMVDAGVMDHDREDHAELCRVVIRDGVFVHYLPIPFHDVCTTAATLLMPVVARPTYPDIVCAGIQFRTYGLLLLHYFDNNLSTIF